MSASKVKWDRDLKPAANAVRILPPLLAAWFAAGRKVASEAAEPADLHRFRLEGKRLRYAMELFRPCYGAGLDRYLQLMRTAQGHLGDYNDCTTLLGMLPKLPGAPAHKARAKNFLKNRSAALYEGFQKFWVADVDFPGGEARWKAYLGHTLPRKK